MWYDAKITIVWQQFGAIAFLQVRSSMGYALLFFDKNPIIITEEMHYETKQAY